MRDLATDAAPLVRPARRSDMPGMLLLWQEMMQRHTDYDSSFELADDAADRWQSAVRDMLGRHDSFVFVLCDAAGLQGFCTGWVAYNPPIYETRSVGLISELTVRQGRRRQGIGSALVQAARAWFAARELPEFQLSTAVNNDAAQAFWRRLGGAPLLVRYRFATDAQNP